MHRQEKCLLYFGSFLQEFSNETVNKDSDFCANLLSCQFKIRFIKFATQLLNQHKKSFANGLLDHVIRKFVIADRGNQFYYARNRKKNIMDKVYNLIVSQYL